MNASEAQEKCAAQQTQPMILLEMQRMTHNLNLLTEAVQRNTEAQRAVVDALVSFREQGEDEAGEEETVVIERPFFDQGLGEPAPGPGLYSSADLWDDDTDLGEGSLP